MDVITYYERFAEESRLDSVPIAERWISIPPNVWHQGVVPGENWVVVSFHTVAEHELIEERPVTEAKDAVRQRKYAGESQGARPSGAAPGWENWDV